MLSPETWIAFSIVSGGESGETVVKIQGPRHPGCAAGGSLGAFRSEDSLKSLATSLAKTVSSIDNSKVF